MTTEGLLSDNSYIMSERSKKSLTAISKQQISKVRVSLVNPDNKRDSKHFTLYHVSVEQLVGRIATDLESRTDQSTPAVPA